MLYTNQKKGLTLISAALITALSAGGAYTLLHCYLGLGGNVATFMWGCVTHPNQNGAFAPCSRYVAEEIVKPLQKQCAEKIRSQKNIRVFEGGAGSGILTREIVKTLHNSGVDFIFDVVEINTSYCKKLSQEFADEPHVRIHCTSILRWSKPQEAYDVIISTVPFSIFDTNDVKKILRLYQDMIKPGGAFSYVKLNGGKLTENVLWGNKKKEFQERQLTLAQFNQNFNAQEVCIKRNIPPLDIYHCIID